MLWAILPILSLQSDFTLTDKGNPKCSIVLPARSSLGTLHGASALVDFIKQMSGATLPIISKPNKGSNIELIQSSKMGSEEYVIECKSNQIKIIGGSLRGVMYGCYGLLQDHFGCHWYTSTISAIPHNSTLQLAPFTDHQMPAFEYREPYFTEAFETNWAARNRINGNSMHLSDAEGGRVIYGKFVHTSSELVPPEIYFKSHPEYYALVNGKRNPDQLELTNPEVAKIAIQTVEKWIQDNPKAKIFSVSQNDNYGQSQSPESQAINKQEGAPSGLLLRFVNKVAAAIAKDHPNVLIDTLAYQWTEKPPLITRPLPNVRIRLAPIGADYAHALNQSPQNKEPYTNLLAWANITHQLYIWSYCTDFASYLQPLPDLDEIANDIPLFKKNGVVGIFYEGDYAPGGGGDMAELKSYLIAHLLWNPNLSAAAIVDDFCDHVYGAAAPEVESWLNLVHESARVRGTPASIYDGPNAPYFTADVLSQGDALFQKALAAVQSDPVALEEVQKAQLGLQRVELGQAKAGTPQYQALAKEVGDKIIEFGIQQTSEGGSSADFLKSIGYTP